MCQNSTIHGPTDPRMTFSQMARSIDICFRHPSVLMKMRSATVSDPVVPLTIRRWKSASLNACEVCQNCSGPNAVYSAM